jgi:UDP-N-acetyl-D-galactosamine dehydrogenase
MGTGITGSADNVAELPEGRIQPAQRQPQLSRDEVLMSQRQPPTVAIVGLGYVGLPLAVAFGRVFPTIGHDLDAAKIANFRAHRDPTGEVDAAQFAAAPLLRVSADPADMAGADFYIVAVPTPIDAAHQPDFGPLLSASRSVGRQLRPGAIVVFESTVYPGATEEVCVPVLERESGLRWREHFHVGYSPERINPGDREHSFTRITKVVSGDDEATLTAVADLYGAVVQAGVYRAGSIKVAEAAKVIENTQRDLNIALMNELALIFERIGIDTLEVLEAAGTKWNFLPFRPGLVGGHCIGVDPYYLTHKADRLGYHPQVILAGRRINDGMGQYVAEQIVKRLIRDGRSVRDAPVVVLGLTFKENVPDVRNSKVVDVIRELESFGVRVHVHDPVADPAEARHEHGVELTAWDALPPAEALVVAVPHRHYRERGLAALCALLRPGGLFADVKSQFDPQAIRSAGCALWRL